MRLWSVHPRHLDRIGLVACWRESLLAQAVLTGATRGYRAHPQLERFRAAPDPIEAIGAYLSTLHADATERGYRFDGAKIVSPARTAAPLPLTEGQLVYEWGHLGRKLEARSPADAARWATATAQAHPLFSLVDGGIETWERPG